MFGYKELNDTELLWIAKRIEYTNHLHWQDPARLEDIREAVNLVLRARCPEPVVRPELVLDPEYCCCEGCTHNRDEPDGLPTWPCTFQWFS